MGFTSEGNNRLKEDVNCRNKDIQHHAGIFKFLSKILFGFDYSIMNVLHVGKRHEYYKIDL
jgi:hypothetical protein